MAGLKQRGGFFAMWQDLTKVLPIGSDHASRCARSELFKDFDVQGTGVCFQANVIRGLLRRLPFIAGISDMKTVLHRAFRATVESVPSFTTAGVCQIDRYQFRFLLLYLWHYFKLWEQFASTDAAQGRKVTLRDFVLAVPAVKKWGCPVGAWEEDPEPVLADLHRGSLQGQQFDDFADLLLRPCLQHWYSTGDAEERAQAIHALRRTHPHMVLELQASASAPLLPSAMASVGKSAMRSHASAAAKQVTMLPTALKGHGGFGGPSKRASRDERWQSQYMNAYLAPRDLPPPKTPSKASVFPCAPDTRQPYAWQKPDRVLVNQFDQQPFAKSQDLGGMELPSPTNRAALRSKFDKQLDMYSTAQMRNLLAVAGGMSVGGK